jgi:Spy/CpxP family protein refolding chaperone
VPNRSVEERVKQFSTMMGLSASQSAKVRRILNTQNEKMRTVAIGNNLTTEQRKKKVDSYRKETDTLIRQVLTAAQRKKFDKLVKEARSKQSSSLKGAPMPGKTRAPIKP